MSPTEIFPERTGPMVRDPLRIGGSDAAAICGKDPNKTAYGVAMRLTGKVQSDDLDGLDHIEFGNEIEGVLSRFYERKEKVKVYVPQTVNHENGFMSVNIDRIRADSVEIGIEAKNTGFHTSEDWGEPGTDEIPMRVMLQVQHGMMVCPSLKLFHVLRCYGGNTYQKFVVPRNDRLIQSLGIIESDFYSDLKKGIVPAPDWGHRTTKDTMKKAFSKIEGETAPAPEELVPLTAEWRAAADVRLAAEKKELALKNKIEFMLGEKGGLVLPDGRWWRRKKVEKNGYTVEPTSYIECRLMKGQ